MYVFNNRFYLISLLSIRPSANYSCKNLLKLLLHCINLFHSAASVPLCLPSEVLVWIRTPRVAVELVGCCGGEGFADKQSVTAPLSQVGTQGHTSPRQGQPWWDWQAALAGDSTRWVSRPPQLVLSFNLPFLLSAAFLSQFVGLFLPPCSSAAVTSLYLLAWERTVDAVSRFYYCFFFFLLCFFVFLFKRKILLFSHTDRDHRDKATFDVDRL